VVDEDPTPDRRASGRTSMVITCPTPRRLAAATRNPTMTRVGIILLAPFANRLLRFDLADSATSVNDPDCRM